MHSSPRAGSAWPWLRNVPTRLQKQLPPLFLLSARSACPIWVPIIGGEPGERLCCLDANPKIEFLLLHCIPATGLQLVGGGGEFSGAGPGDPSSFILVREVGQGQQGKPGGEGWQPRGSSRCEVKLGHCLFPRVCSKVGERLCSNLRSHGQPRPWWAPPVVKGRYPLCSVSGYSDVLIADCYLSRDQRAASAPARVLYSRIGDSSHAPPHPTLPLLIGFPCDRFNSWLG